MRYQGSKRRIAKHILPIILANRSPGQLYVEPFVGGANSFELVENPRLGYDVDHDTITALIMIRDYPDSLPKNNLEFTEQDYKDRKKIPSFAAFAYSYAGRKWQGWSRDSIKTDYVKRAYNNAIKQSPKLKGSVLQQSDYLTAYIPDGSIVYCDPPYKNTKKYRTGQFDHETFWSWAEELSNRCQVFVSEYEAPPNWVCLWQKEINSSLTKDTGGKKGVEKLFKLKEGLS